MEFVVVRVPGAAWDHTRPMREQDGWADHARFMDDLAASGFIVLGGPLGDGERRFMHVCDAESDAAARSRFDTDPWTPDLLEIETVERWAVLLRAP
jgi:uncharacterized protein YciI